MRWGIAFLISASSQLAFADVLFAPPWAGKEHTPVQNQSYLSTYSTNLDPNHTPLIDKLMDPKMANQLELEYADLVRRHEYRKQHDLTSHEDERNYMSRLMGFTRYLLYKVFNKQIDREVARASKNSSEVRTFNNVQAQARAVVGGSTSFAVEEQFKIGTKSDLRNSKGQLWVRSALVDGSIDFDLSREDASLPSISDRKERYQFSLSRELPIGGIRSGLSYGLVNTMMTASLTKSMSENVRVVLDTRRPLNTIRTTEAGQERLQLLYDLTF